MQVTPVCYVKGDGSIHNEPLYSADSMKETHSSVDGKRIKKDGNNSALTLLEYCFTVSFYYIILLNSSLVHGMLFTT